ncbi:beta-lactamase family protein [Actinoplanes sp. LDG1-06]|uniref:Beta-lactamase family protein n=1 Tax=Paractinoplanes ovalisporus TaxID=2810368 RepID=A0ABS2A7J6_9ACTN|nr:serine hydrolase domain-containing protein [Actinoplanes ovalisporus]MBM2615767.1 beta-lactamase family protein [Actinoplanes ovalisporus]
MLRALVVALLLGAPAVLPSSPDIDGYLREQRAELRIPGLAYAVVDRDRVVRQGAWGVDARTPFLIGSVSKPVTATAVMRLVDAGRVGLDDPVRQHVPWFRLADERAAARITVRQLLTHTSGLQQWASRTDRFDNSPDGLARSVRDLASVEPAGQPGRAHVYSDANYMVLGALVETVSGQSFAEFLRREVFLPLGMNTATASSPVGLPAGHRYWFGQPRRFDPGYDTSGAPYGYIAAGLGDMARFAQAHLDDRYAPMHTGQADGGRYGLGWRVTELDGHRIVWHAGATPGYFAHVVLVPGADRAVVVLADSYSLARDGALAALGFDIARMTLGGTPQPAGSDPVFGIALLVLSVAAVLLVAGLIRPARRRRWQITTALATLLVAAFAVLGLPALLGGDIRQAMLWTPDLAWTALVVAALAVAVAARNVSQMRAATGP